MTPADPLLASCAAIVLLHAVAYYVWIAVHAPSELRGHETTIAPMEGEQR